MSSPARGTWIEIEIERNPVQEDDVVPRKGDVDRNANEPLLVDEKKMVVPRKGDVDRNPFCFTVHARKAGRPPQGGRG